MTDSIVDCCICGQSTRTVYTLNYLELIGMSPKYTMRINYCKNCEYFFVSNPFSVEKLNNRYSNFSKFEFDDEDYFLDEDLEYKKRSLRQKHFIERCVDSNEIKTILEIGAASGYNLSLYKNRYQVLGVEPSSKNCENAFKKYQVEEYCGVFEDFYRSYNGKSKWDLVFLSHTLEHIVNPYKFIVQCSNLNTKYVFIEVPTFDYKFSNEPFGMFCEEHVNLFTLSSLQNMMNKCGYSLINADICMCVDQKLPAGFPSIATLWKKNTVKKYQVINDAYDLFERYIVNSELILGKIQNLIVNIPNNERIAIWGTGHHFSFLIANTELLKKNIVRIYDSDKRKQGTKVCNIEITEFSPQDIDSGAVESVIILSYVAQDAIHKRLVEYSDKVKLYCLYDQ